jgi:hypothetical protein
MKTQIILAALLLASAPAFAADNPPPPATSSAGGSVCLRHHDVDGWGSRDKHSMIVNDRFGRKYLISLAGLCDDVDFAMGAGFRPLGGMSLGTCVDRGDRVVLRGGGAFDSRNSTCWVSKVQLYSKEMEAADKLARANKQPLAAY